MVVIVLTPAEEALWLLHRLAPDSGIANVAVKVFAPAPLRREPLAAALRWVISRHPALRSSFPLREGGPVRVVAAETDVEIDVRDVTAEQLDDVLREIASRPFDLDRPPLIRLSWLRIAADRQMYCIVVHHLAIDAVGMEILVDEINAAYRTIVRTGRPPDLPPPAPAPATEGDASSLAYWRARLAGIDPAAMRLDVAREPGSPATFAAELVDRVFSATTSQQIRELGVRSRSTEAAVFLAAYLVALRGLGASDDALIGVLTDTRANTGATALGYYIATLPLRIRIDPNRTLANLAMKVTASMWSAIDHAGISYEAIAPELTSGNGDARRTGTLRHLFNYRAVTAATDGGMSSSDMVHTGLSRYDIELIVDPVGDRHHVRLIFSTEVHDDGFGAALLDRIESLIRQCHANPGQPIRELDPRTPAEIALLDRVNATDVTWSGPVTAPALVAEVAAAHPDSVAVVADGRRITYRMLMRCATAVRDLLHHHGVRDGDIVGVASPRGPELAAAVLGVWAVGAAFLPLDSEFPAERLRHQVDDAGVRLVLDGHLLPADAMADVTIVATPRADSAGPAASGGWSPGPTRPDQTAYLIYTSGSTGRPKGVRVPHGSLHNVLRHFATILDADSGTSALWLTTFAFDISILELFLPLTVGGRVVVADDHDRVNPGRLGALVRAENVSVLQSTPTLWRMVLAHPHDWLAGRTVLCGGEPLVPALARDLQKAGCRTFNVYGPTETTIWSTVAPLIDGDQITVGTPIANTRVFIRHVDGSPRPAGVSGELCVAGAGVTEGYHGQPDLTAERFPTDPTHGRYYRTGDIARLRPDGRLELLGRRDRQVKLRGHRIELGEVESVLTDHDEVGNAVVLVHGERDDDSCLLAFLTATERPGLVDELWRMARTRLPAYSLPGRFVFLDEMPRTANGKIDILALRTYESVPVVPSPERAESGDDRGRRLLEICRDVLKAPDLGYHANFFLHGGSSLSAAVLADRLTSWCESPVSMAMIFEAPSAAELAVALRLRADAG